MPLFPRHTVALTAEDAFLRHVVHSTAGTAVVTGVLVQLFHAVMEELGSAHSNALFAISVLGRFAILLGFTTLALGSHPVHQWKWRAPLFAACEIAASAVTFAVLIAVHAAWIGTTRARWSDWTREAGRILKWHGIIILVFAILLGITVQLVRYGLLRHEHRDSTAQRIHADHVKQEQEAS